MAEYSIDVRIYGTIYIQAESAKEAQSKASDTAMTALNVHGDIDLGDGVKLSSMMTIHGPDEGDEVSE